MRSLWRRFFKRSSISKVVIKYYFLDDASWLCSPTGADRNEIKTLAENNQNFHVRQNWQHNKNIHIKSWEHFSTFLFILLAAMFGLQIKWEKIILDPIFVCIWLTQMLLFWNRRWKLWNRIDETIWVPSMVELERSRTGLIDHAR